MNAVMDYCEDDFERGYDAGYEACQRDQQRRLLKQKQQKEALRKKELYFLKQKLIGVLCLVYTVIAVIVMDGDATVALVTVPLGLAMIFSRTMLWTNDYYYEMEEKERRARKNGKAAKNHSC